jgi:hypothetical protein
MSILSRRSVLAGLAATPVFGASLTRSTESARPQKCGKRDFHVYLHGAFVLDVQKDGCFLIAPEVQETGKPIHEYRFGYGAKLEGELISGAARVLALDGFGGGGHSYPTVDKTILPRLDKIETNNSSGHYIAWLKTPARITPLRQIAKSQNTPFFDEPSGAASLRALQSLPLLVRLEYDLQAGESPTLAGTNWVDDCSNPLRVHFRAEPGDKNLQDHDALGALAQVAGLPKLKINSCYDTAFTCFKSDDEKSLIEVRDTSTTKCSDVPACAKDKIYIRGHRPANCVAIVLNNTGQPLE